MEFVTKKEKEFLYVISLIKNAKNKAFLKVNIELIDLYWNIGKYISKKIESAEWGDKVIANLADYISKKNPELKGFNFRNLHRMKQFYEVYKENTIVSALLTQLSWTHNLMIISKTKSMEEKIFYINLSIKERYSSRELERQIDSGYFERVMISKVSPLVTKLPKDIVSSFKDTYILDFLDLPKDHSEKDLQKALIKNFKNFVLEFGKDFAFMGEEYKIQVGKNDYFIDLLFYHRGLRCLVVFELKIEDFKPEFLGKINFYLEALDRDVKKEYENPSVGVVLCKSKDNEVVEYALSRSLSPALVSEYKTKLIDKDILRKKLNELYLFLDKNNKES